MNLEENKILVIGDIILDIYFFGEVTRISPEAPVPIFNKKTEKYVLGGASNVAVNLVAANQDVTVFGCIGDDKNGHIISALFKEMGINDEGLFFTDRETTTKTRFIAENNQQVMRLDVENKSEYDQKFYDNIIHKYKNIVNNYKIIVISDYMKGLLSKNFLQSIINIAKKNNIKVIIDVKDSDYTKYAGAYLLKPNTIELQRLTNCITNSREDIINASLLLKEKTGCENVLTTCGNKGMVLVSSNCVKSINTAAKSVYDVTGAGDTTIAYLAACIANNYSLSDAMNIANHAAGIQVGKVGTSAVYIHEVQNSLLESRLNKAKPIFTISNRSELTDLVKAWKLDNKTIVTTNGCFDILHKGHILLLKKAKTFGDKLIVLLNSDKSVQRLKGVGRPINNENDRAMVLSALEYVDAVVIFDPDIEGKTEIPNSIAPEAPISVMQLIQPDIHVKGGDYTIEQVPEARYAKEFKTVNYLYGYSTSNTIWKSKRSVQKNER